MIKIIFGVIFAGALYYVINPLMGRRVSWVDAEDPDDERMRELVLAKKINLKALKDIEFELASGKINDEDFLELRDHYAHKVSRVMGLIEDLAGEEKRLDEDEDKIDEDEGGLDEGEIDEDEGGDGDEDGDQDDDEDDDDDDDEDELDENEDGDEDDGEEDEEILQASDDDYEDEEWDEDEDDEYEHRSVKGPTLAVLALVLAVGVGVALFQMGKRSATPVTAVLAPAYTAPAPPAPVAPAPVAPTPVAPAPVAPTPVAPTPAALAPTTPTPTEPVASLPSQSSGQAGLEHLVKYVQENPWNVTSHLILGEYYLDAGDINVALAHFTSAEGIKPDNGRVLNNLGKTFRQLGNTDQAIEKFQAASAAEPEALEHLYQLGLVYGYDKGNLTKALALFEEILSRQPDENMRVTVDEELRKLGLSEG